MIDPGKLESIDVQQMLRIPSHSYWSIRLERGSSQRAKRPGVVAAAAALTVVREGCVYSYEGVKGRPFFGDGTISASTSTVGKFLTASAGTSNQQSS
jgi:hypothetical protein